MEHSRRQLLGALSAAVVGSLAGCNGGGGDGATTPTETETAEQTSTEAVATDSRTETTTATPTETATPTPTPTPVDADIEVAVGPGDFVFEPETFEISAGDTVLWVWEGDGHNVKPTAAPDDSDWSGTPGDDGDTYSTGYEYAYTFEVPGEYEYHCVPHQSLDMVGSFTVTE